MGTRLHRSCVFNLTNNEQPTTEGIHVGCCGLWVVWYHECMFSNPGQILDAFGISPGMVVGDFGTGDGAYARELARRVGRDGIVYAFDVQKQMIDKLVAYVEHERTTTIRPIWCDLELPHGTTLGDRSLDVAVIANIFFQIEHKEAFLAEVARTLRPNARVLVVDWSESYGHMGPHPDHVVSHDDMKGFARGAGLVFDKTIDAGEHHYGLVFRKQGLVR